MAVIYVVVMLKHNAISTLKLDLQTAGRLRRPAATVTSYVYAVEITQEFRLL